MVTNYVTMGQSHVHMLGNQLIDHDCVVTYETETGKEGRQRAHDLFGVKFCFHYVDSEFKMDSMKYFPRGLISV